MEDLLLRVFLVLWLLAVTLSPVLIGVVLTEAFSPGSLSWVGIAAALGLLYFLCKDGLLRKAWKAALTAPIWKDSP
jgi:hypothetical protein